MSAANPYENLPPEAFWRPAVADKSVFEIGPVWTPKSKLGPDDPVATYGSCFAQAVGRTLKATGFNWLRTERPPYGLAPKNVTRFGYDVFSSRTGNIYTTALLHQWVSWAAGKSNPPEEVWVQDGRYFDPFRPTIEPNGFESAQEVHDTRAETIRCFGESIRKSHTFLFTMGMTEAWINTQTKCEYSVCPGTAAGVFDPGVHQFVNHDYEAVRSHLGAALGLMQEMNPSLRFILTVSPVPMVATQSGLHVVVATMQTKSILRAVAADFTTRLDCVDYFPGYEIANSPAYRAMVFSPNQRTLSDFGVRFVMDQFSAGLGHPTRQTELVPEMEFLCEEELLDAFATGSEPSA